jgi:TAP-like protein
MLVPLPGSRPVRVTFDEGALFELLGSTDVDPFLRSEFPAALRSALAGDTAALRRMVRQSSLEGGFGNPGDSLALNFATMCEESALPWSRTAPPTDRLAQALAAVHALPPSTFFPFDADVALTESPVDQCLNWPQAPTFPDIGGGPLPAVPALVLEGSDDLRTPIEGAQRMVAQLPEATLIQVPGTGHDTLDSDFNGCASRALAQFAVGQPGSQCPDPARRIFARPLAPRSLSALPWPAGLDRRTGETLVAVAETVRDVDWEAYYDALTTPRPLSVFVSDVGLRGGSFSGRVTGLLRLRQVVYAPGVMVSGTVDPERDVAHLSVSGGAGAHGTLSAVGTRITARLGRHSVSLITRASIATRTAPSAAWTWWHPEGWSRPPVWTGVEADG